LDQYCTYWFSRSAKGRRGILCIFPRHAMHSREKTSRGDTWRAHVTSTESPTASGGAHGTNMLRTREGAPRSCARAAAKHPRSDGLATDCQAASDPSPRTLTLVRDSPRGQSPGAVMGLCIELDTYLNYTQHKIPYTPHEITRLQRHTDRAIEDPYSTCCSGK